MITVTSIFFNNLLGSFTPNRKLMTATFVSSSQVAPPTPPKPSTPPDDHGIRKMTRVSEFHKKVLVFAKRFKSVAEVPDLIPVEMLEKARSKARIRLSNYLMILTGVGCLAFAYSGRKAAERGESVVKMNQDWHKEYNERVKAETEAASQGKK